MEEHWDAIVIGSGMGGLTAAAFLAKAGLRPLVLEKHFAPGGYAQTFRRKKMFDFDVGLHYIGDCQPGGMFPEMLGDLDVADQVEFVPMDQDGFDTIRFPDLVFRVPAGWDRYRQRLIEAFPQEAAAIDRYVDFLRAVGGVFAGAPPPVEPPLRSVLPRAWHQATLGEVFDALEVSHRLRHVLGAHAGIYALPPSRAPAAMHALIMQHYLRGAYFIRGGARPLVQALVQTIEDSGGEVRLRSPVDGIVIDEGKAVGVQLAKGGELRAPIVVSNADAKRTFLALVGEEHLSPAFAQRVKDFRMALPLFVVYLAMAVDPSELGLPATNVSLVPAYDVEEQYATCEEGRMPDKPHVGISIASLKDPVSSNIAPPGYTNLQLITLAPRGAEAWGAEPGAVRDGGYRHTAPYVAARREMKERVFKVVEEMMPGFIRRVVWEECATPLTQERFTFSSEGTSYGLEHTLDQFMGARVPFQTEIPGLWMVGANTIFGHGIAGTMLSGRTAAAVIARSAR